jgi:glycosyltransferase involved in cell wall biosynthesis
MLHLRVVAGTGGGPEKTILNSPRFIRNHGFDAHVVYLCPPADSIGDKLRSKGKEAECDLHIIPDRGPFDWRTVREVIRVCKQHKISLLQTHDYKSNAIGLIVRRFHRCAMATMLHGWTDMSGRMPLYKRIDQWCLPYFEKLICVSEDLVDECHRLRIPSHKVHLIHNGIDTNQFQRTLTRSEAKRRVGAYEDRLLIGSVGRLSPEKGFLQLIEVVSNLRQVHPIPIDLWIAGDGPQRDELESAIERLGLNDSVRLLGQRNDLRDFYQAMDMFLLNSIREGLPNVLLEAMAMETPVIATAIAGIPKLISHRIDGLLISPGKPQELQSAIEELLVSEEKRHALTVHARCKIEQDYSFEKRIEKVVAIYNNLLKKNHG